MQHLYEVILDRELDKRNFRKKVLSMEIVQETNEIEKDVAHRAARLYRFDKRRYDRLASGVSTSRFEGTGSYCPFAGIEVTDR